MQERAIVWIVYNYMNCMKVIWVMWSIELHICECIDMCYKVWFMIEVKGVIEMYDENMQVSLS